MKMKRSKLAPMAASILFGVLRKSGILKIDFLHNKNILRTAGGLWIVNLNVVLLKIIQKKSSANCGTFCIQKILRNYFFSNFSILAFNAANPRF